MSEQATPAGGAPTAGCPNPKLIRAIHRGEVSESTIDAWGDHLESCPLCEKILAELDKQPDPLLRAFGGLALRTRTHDPQQSQPAQVEEPLPRPIGPYVLENVIGRGGMGVVYRARHRRLDRLAALKRLSGPVQAGDEAVQRFRTECDVVARLIHPNITVLYEFGWEDGRPWFAMEYVGGGTLAERLRAGPLSAADAAELLIPIAKAIHFAHGNGVIHRDLKPSNILLTGVHEPAAQARDDTHDPLLAPRAQLKAIGQPKVSDFGLAKLADQSVALTMTGKVMGTPAYMAPEQARGQNNLIGAHTDVYSLGAVLYECLTQRPPFVGSDAHELLRQAIEDEPVPPRQVVPKLPRDLETICLKCLHKDPARRYESAQALAEDLQRFREGRPIVARPVGRIERGIRWCRRKPGTATNIAVAAVLLIGLIVALFAYQASVNEKDRQTADARLRDEQQKGALELAEQAKRNAERLAAATRFANILSENSERGVSRRLGWIPQNQAALREAATMDVDQMDQLARMRTQLAATLAATGMSPPNELFIPLAKGSKESLGPGPIAFHPKGKQLAVAQHITDQFEGTVRWFCVGFGVVHLLDARDWQIVRTLYFPAPTNLLQECNGANCLAFSPDGNLLALAARDGRIHLWDLNEPDSKCQTWMAHRQDIGTLAFYRDGKTLISSAHYDRTICWNLETWLPLSSILPVSFGTPVPAATIDHKALDVWDVTLSPPNARDEFVALSTHDGSIHFLDSRLNKEVEAISKVGRLPAISPDGRSVAIVEGLNLVVIDRQTRRIAYQLMAADQNDIDANIDEKLVFSPDGSLLATANEGSGLVKLWEIASGKLVAVGRAKGGRCNLAFSPEGQTLVASGESNIFVFRIDASMAQAHQGITPGPIRCFAFDSTGSKFAALALHKPNQNPGDLGWWNAREWPQKLWAENQIPCNRAIGRNAAVESFRTIALNRKLAPGLFYRQDMSLCVWDPNKKTSDKIVDAPEVEVVRCIGQHELLLGDGSKVRHYNWRSREGKTVFENSAVEDETGRGGIRQVFAHERWYLIADGAGYVHLIDAKGRQKPVSRRLDEFKIQAATISPSGEEAIVGDFAGKLYRLKLPSLEIIQQLPPHDGSVEEVVYIREDLIATASLDHTVRFMNPNGEILFSIPFERPVVQMALAIDGGSAKLAVLLRNERAIRIWHLDRLEKRFSEFGIGLPLTP